MGRQFIILCANALVLFAGVWNVSSAEDNRSVVTGTVFEKPVRLEADGKPIDTGEAWGHSGPAMWDVDNDDLLDLVVGDFSGKFRIFRNVGTKSSPKYSATDYIMAGEQPAQVPIYCCIGSSPLFADYDGDGRTDLLSGSYDPGECYLFSGLQDGTFAERKTLTGVDGKPVLRVPDQQQPVQSFGSWPALVDWDNDADLDVLIGGFDGTMFVRINEGTRQSPKLSATNERAKIGDDELKVPGGHAAVAVADWNNDGLWDILSGCDTGAVYWYRNIGKKGAPSFAKEELLVAKHEGSGYEELVETEPAPGIRSQITVVDYNHDGKLDLLLGDFCTALTPRPDLTAVERATLRKISQQSADSTKEWTTAMTAMREDFFKRYPGDAINGEEATKEWQKSYVALRDGEIYKRMEAEQKRLQVEQRKYVIHPEKPGIGNELAAPHGYVWLYLRK